MDMWKQMHSASVHFRVRQLYTPSEPMPQRAVSVSPARPRGHIPTHRLSSRVLSFTLWTPYPGRSVTIWLSLSLKWRPGLVAIPKAHETLLPTVTPNLQTGARRSASWPAPRKGADGMQVPTHLLSRGEGPGAKTAPGSRLGIFQSNPRKERGWGSHS